VLVSKPLPQLLDETLGRRERRAVTMHGFAVRQDGSTAPVRLTDLSNDGCGLEMTAELEPGERIELLLHGRGAMAAHVRWYANGRAGVTFEAVPVAQKQSSRTCERRALATEVTLRRTGRPSYRVRVLDISTSGCRLDVVDRLDVDEHVWVKFDGLEAFEATVCWFAGFKVGLRYANPIHSAVFDQMMKWLERH
jgi:hypothetical protein